MVFLTDCLKPNNSCIIVYPRLIKKENIVHFLTEKWDNTVIITESTKECDCHRTVSYKDFNLISTELRSKQTVVFDDIKMLSLIIEMIDLSKIKAKIIILSTWGDDFENLDLVTAKLPTLLLFYLNIIEDAKIDWNVIINKEVFDSVCDGISSNWPSKQLVFTSYLEEMARHLKENPYEIHEIITISCEEDYEEIIKKIHQFNSLETGILLTNIIPLLDLKNVNMVHITEPTDIRMLLLKCCCQDIIMMMHFPEVNDKITTMLEKIKEWNRIYLGLVSFSQKLINGN